MLKVRDWSQCGYNRYPPFWCGKAFVTQARHTNLFESGTFGIPIEGSRDTGHFASNRDCPAEIGTVGQSEIASKILGHSKNRALRLYKIMIVVVTKP